MKIQQNSQSPGGRHDRGALERKSFDVQFKALDESGSFDAYVAIFGNVDRWGDVIAPGAFRNLADFEKSGWITVSHDWSSLPVAMIETAVQDGVGLRVTGRFHATPEAQSCRIVTSERLAAGKTVACSIGYRTIESAPQTVDGKTVNILKSIDVYEASFVNIPANAMAQASSVKSADKLLTLDQVESRIASYKAGRVLSAASRSRLKALADGLHGHGGAACAMAKDLRDWLAQYDDDQDDDDEEEEEEDVNESKSADAALRLRVESGRLGAACP